MEIREGGLDHPAVRELLALHQAQALANTPANYAHVLDLSGLSAPDVSFFTAWEGDMLLGMAALRRLDAGNAEVKSMRTHPARLRCGVAWALLGHLIATARSRGYRRLSLETGYAPPFHAANRMYETAGFSDCGAFGGYINTPHNRLMTLVL